jgi:hypothetical protein
MNGPKQKRFTSPKLLASRLLKRTNLIISGLKIKAMSKNGESNAIFGVLAEFHQWSRWWISPQNRAGCFVAFRK